MSLASPQFVINPGPIIGAGERGNIGDIAAPLPNVSGALRGWFKPMVIGLFTSVNVNGSPVKKIVEISTSGMLQAGDAEVLKLLPEGDRSWKSVMLHVLPGLGVQTSDQIKIKGVTYRVMQSTDYEEYGFTQFDLVEGYRDAAGF